MMMTREQSYRHLMIFTRSSERRHFEHENIDAYQLLESRLNVDGCRGIYMREGAGEQNSTSCVLLLVFVFDDATDPQPSTH